MDVWLRISTAESWSKSLTLVVTPFKKFCGSQDLQYRQCRYSTKCVRRELFCDGRVNCAWPYAEPAGRQYVQCVLCTMYSVQYVQCTVYSMYNVQCTVCTMYSVQYVQCTVYSMYNVQCTVFSMYNIPSTWYTWSVQSMYNVQWTVQNL